MFQRSSLIAVAPMVLTRWIINCKMNTTSSREAILMVWSVELMVELLLVVDLVQHFGGDTSELWKLLELDRR